jgi:hypothetical protein
MKRHVFVGWCGSFSHPTRKTICIYKIVARCSSRSAEAGDLSQFNTAKAAAVFWGRALPRRVDQNPALDLSADRKEMSLPLPGDTLDVY